MGNDNGTGPKLPWQETTGNTSPRTAKQQAVYLMEVKRLHMHGSPLASSVRWVQIYTPTSICGTDMCFTLDFERKLPAK